MMGILDDGGGIEENSLRRWDLGSFYNWNSDPVSSRRDILGLFIICTTLTLSWLTISCQEVVPSLHENEMLRTHGGHWSLLRTRIQLLFLSSSLE